MVQLLIINDNSFTAGAQEINGIEYEVTLSLSPLHAFNRIIHISPDAIIINMDNPGMDCDMVYKRIRNMQASKTVPVILMARPEEEDAFGGYLSDANSSFVSDALDNDAIIDSVGAALGLSGNDKKKCLMIVDDDPAVRDISKLYLGAKYDIITMDNAQKALSELGELVPDLILLDIAMPEIDGKELYRRIRTIPGCENIPILFQTGMAGMNTVRECVSLGAAGFVIKPIQKSLLLEKVDECLNPPPEKEKIVVFEEHDFMFIIFQGQLKEKFELVRAESVIQCINILEKTKAKCFILDMSNPSFGINRLKDKAEEIRIPIVIITGEGGNEVMKRESGPNTYFLPAHSEKSFVLNLIDSIEGWKEE